MLHQTIPLYEGNLPFFYACYTEDDEVLAFPILARMYNEGFRLWCARAGGISGTDFRSIQRLSSSSCVVLFMSRAMLALIRRGEPEMLAVLKNSLLRIVVCLDGCEFDSSLFALSVPDCINYNPGADAAFWLYTYSSDQLEKCRGPWPEKKLSLRDTTAAELAAENMDEEYRSLESIIGPDGSRRQAGEQPEQSPEQQGRAEQQEQPEESEEREEAEKEAAAPPSGTERYPNQPGYIRPEKDERKYIPLGTVRAAKSRQDEEYDEVMDMIDRAVSRQSEIIEAHSYAFVPEPQGERHIAPPMALDAKWYSEQPLPPPTQEELDSYDDAFPVPPTEPKTDVVITPEDASEAAEGQAQEQTEEQSKEQTESPESTEKSATTQPQAAPILITLPDGSTLPQLPMMEGGAAIIYVPLAQKTDGTQTITYLPINAAQAAPAPAVSAAPTAPTAPTVPTVPTALTAPVATPAAPATDYSVAAPTAAAQAEQADAAASTEDAAQSRSDSTPAEAAETTETAEATETAEWSGAEEEQNGQEPLLFETLHDFGDSRQSMVPVVVRRQHRPAVRVKPVERSIITPVIEDDEPDRVAHYSRQRRLGERLTRTMGSQRLEQMVRDIALSVINDEQPAAAEEQPAPTARKFKGRTVVPVPQNAPEPAPMPETDTALSAEEAEAMPAQSAAPQEEKPSHRKNRHPHRKGLFASLMAALRHESYTETMAEAAEVTAAEVAATEVAENTATEQTEPVDSPEAPATNAVMPEEMPENAPESITEEAQPAAEMPEAEAKAKAEETGLQGAIHRFSEKNSAPRVQVVPKRKE